MHIQTYEEDKHRCNTCLKPFNKGKTLWIRPIVGEVDYLVFICEECAIKHAHELMKDM